MIALVKTLQVFLALSILIIVHEFGHFLWARIFKIRVEKFYIFFNPWFSLFKYKPKNSDTTFGIGWLPLGGYVKIAGMIDESMDMEQMKQDPQPWEFRSKNVWQRFCIIIGGILVNFIAALVIFGHLLYICGKDSLPLSKIDTGLYYSEILLNEGFEQQNMQTDTTPKSKSEHSQP